MENKKTSFCVLPWLHSFVNVDGSYQVCCLSEEFNNKIIDSDGNPYNLSNRPSLEDVMNSDFMKNLRLKMINGEWDLLCSRCHETETMGGTSRRNLENLQYKDQIQELINETKTDGKIKFKFKLIDYRLGNLCNLQCRMCNPFSSNQWIKSWNTVKPKLEQITDEELKRLEFSDWTEGDALLEEFTQKIEDTNQIHFAGGEPFINNKMIKMLEICCEKGLAHKITLSYNTNVTQLPKRLMELWKEFKAIKLLCSIDGHKAVNEYIRFPSNWSHIDKNFMFLDENFHALKIQEIILSTTVQIYNILELRDLYKYLSKFKNITPALNLINLNYPSYMSTKVLSVEAKSLAEIRLVEIAEDLKKSLVNEKDNYLIDNIYQSIEFMKSEDFSSMSLSFIKVNKDIDNLKKLSLEKSLPELNYYIKKQILNSIRI